MTFSTARQQMERRRHQPWWILHHLETQFHTTKQNNEIIRLKKLSQISTNGYFYLVQLLINILFFGLIFWTVSVLCHVKIWFILLMGDTRENWRKLYPLSQKRFSYFKTVLLWHRHGHSHTASLPTFNQSVLIMTKVWEYACRSWQSAFEKNVFAIMENKWRTWNIMATPTNIWFEICKIL
jgi:hypothetical protein